MSFQMTHMQIAYNLIDKWNITEGKGEFILGSVAPDSVHFRDDYSVEQKIHTHLFEGCGPWGDTQDYENWSINIDSFLDRYLKNEADIKKKMFILGIGVHCITDYYNDLLIWRDGQRKHIPPMTSEGFREAFYSEAPIVDKWLFQNSEDSDEICQLFKNSVEYEVEGYIQSKDLVALKKHLIDVQYNLEDKIDVSGFKYYPAEKILWFTKTVTENIYSKLSNRLYQ